MHINAAGQIIVDSCGHPIECTTCPCSTGGTQTVGCCSDMSPCMQVDPLAGDGYCSPCHIDNPQVMTLSTVTACLWQSTLSSWYTTDNGIGGCGGFGANITGRFELRVVDNSTACTGYQMQVDVTGSGSPSSYAVYRSTFGSTHIHENGFQLAFISRLVNPFTTPSYNCNWTTGPITVYPC